MGIYDRDYAREPQQGLQLGLPASMVNRLILITGVVYLIQYFGSEAFTLQLALWSDWFRTPWRVFQLLTYGFLHSPHDVLHILGNMFVLWMFGREIERRYGQHEFLRFYLTAIVMAGLFWTGWEIAFGKTLAAQQTSGIVYGASGAVAATVALFALNFPRRTVYLNFFIPVPMWIAGVLMLSFDIGGASGRFGAQNVAYAAHLGGAAFGALYFYTQWLPLRWLGNLSGKLPKVGRPNLRVHDPDAGHEDLQAQVDRILEKINTQGQDSLTWRERRTLEQASRKYRENRR